MNSSVEPLPVSDQFEVLAELLIFNNWAKRPKLDEMRGELVKQKGEVVLKDKRAMGRFLVEKRVLTSEQMTELDNILQQQLNFPNYQLLKRLGAGGMGTVYLAKHIESGRTLAIKTMMARLKEDPDFIGRFHRESKVLTGLHHKYIADIYESGESGNACFMAMEYVEGPSLGTLLKEHKVLPEVYVLQIGKQVAEGLEYVYDQAELVHRDIKPENILISRHPSITEPFPPDDMAKLIDFGLVKPVDDDQHLTQTGMTIGTPLYMSPEQIRGEKIDCRSDIYGLGATMYHLLTGQTPFSGTSPGAIMSAHLTQPVPDPGMRVPSLHQKTRELIMMAMSKQKDSRYLTFTAFIKALESALAEFSNKSGTSPKLLRKPMVIKGPVRKTPLPVAEDEDDDSDGDSSSYLRVGADSIVHATNRILNKFKSQKEQAGLNGEESDGTNAVVSKIISTTVRTKKPKNKTTKKTKRIDLPTEVMSKRPLERSAVFDEDPTEAAGTGIIPWIVLVLAIAALAVYFLF